jgi:hypothetical protein
MNAYELADELQGFGFLENDLNFCPFQAQVDMLRMQAEKIADLQTTINFLENECKALRKQVNEAQL